MNNVIPILSLKFTTFHPKPGTAVGTVGSRCEVHVLVKGLVDPEKEIARWERGLEWNLNTLIVRFRERLFEAVRMRGIGWDTYVFLTYPLSLRLQQKRTATLEQSSNAKEKIDKHSEKTPDHVIKSDKEKLQSLLAEVETIDAAIANFQKLSL